MEPPSDDIAASSSADDWSDNVAYRQHLRELMKIKAGLQRVDWNTCDELPLDDEDMAARDRIKQALQKAHVAHLDPRDF